MEFSKSAYAYSALVCLKARSSTCVVITGTGILNSGTQIPLKMLSDSISYYSNFKIFQFQHYYSIMHAIVRGCIMCLVV